jgi:hypothetical protein
LWSTASVGSVGAQLTVAYGYNRFVILQSNGPLYYTETNPGAWTQGTTPGTSYGNWVGLEYIHNKFFAISNTGYISSSATGYNSWSTPTQIATTALGNLPPSVTQSNLRINRLRVDPASGFMVAGYYDNSNAARNGVYVSDDGVTWNYLAANFAEGLDGVNITQKYIVGVRGAGTSMDNVWYVDMTICRPCPIGQGKGAGSVGNTTVCTDCDDGYYSPNDDDDICHACQPAQGGGTVGTWNTNNSPPSPYGSTNSSMCYEKRPYSATNCLGFYKCGWRNTRPGAYICDPPYVFDYELTHCPCGYYWPGYPTPSPTPIDGECVGDDYYSPNGDVQRYQCLSGTKTSGCGTCACASGDCKAYVKLRNSATPSAPIFRADTNVGHPRMGISYNSTNYYRPLTTTPVSGGIVLSVGGVNHYLSETFYMQCAPRIGIGDAKD